MHHAGLVVFALVLLIVALSFGPSVAAFVLLAALVGFAALAAGIWLVDYRSPGARFDRAVSAGRLGDAVRCCLECRDAPRLDSFLPTAFDRWRQAGHGLYAASRELIELERAIDSARSVGVPRPILDSLSVESRISGEVLVRLADRLGAVEAQGVDSDAIRRVVDDEASTLDGLAAGLHAARIGLAELTLRGGQDPEQTRALRAAGDRLRALGDAARDVASLDRR